MPKKRALAWVGYEYDDGCQSVHTAEPSDIHPTIRFVPVELVKAYEDAQAAAVAAGKALLEAWTAAPERRNPKYVEDGPEDRG